MVKKNAGVFGVPKLQNARDTLLTFWSTMRKTYSVHFIQHPFYLYSRNNAFLSCLKKWRISLSINLWDKRSSLIWNRINKSWFFWNSTKNLSLMPFSFASQLETSIVPHRVLILKKSFCQKNKCFLVLLVSRMHSTLPVWDCKVKNRLFVDYCNVYQVLLLFFQLFLSASAIWLKKQRMKVFPAGKKISVRKRDVEH